MHFYSFMRFKRERNRISFFQPNMGAPVSKPLSWEVILKSHCADGRTKDRIVIPSAVSAYINPQIKRSDM